MKIAEAASKLRGWLPQVPAFCSVPEYTLPLHEPQARNDGPRADGKAVNEHLAFCYPVTKSRDGRVFEPSTLRLCGPVLGGWIAVRV